MRFAEHSNDPRLQPVIARLAAPTRVAVLGRDGVGRGTVAAALAASGVTIAADATAGDVQVVVVAEAVKPEDQAFLVDDKPSVMVLNKADLTGLGDGGPLARAHRRAAECRALTGVPTVPMIALLATAELDDELMRALRVLVTEPAALTSTDAFVGGAHSVPLEIRHRLLATLDRFGIASALLALGEGADVSTVLRRASQADRVIEYIAAVAAPLRYRRLQTAITELRSLAVLSDTEQLADFLSTDTTVLAVMSAAVDVVEAVGVRVDRGDDAAAHLRRAVHWRHYSRGPVSALHRSCGADIARGSLRLLGQAR
ncbi:hypothetical protein Mycsm_00141 [Mycobacterium sp. JS623]|uniref:hypothetical protein n=1 Tax=Mycobacterium sp. JS623 TaxID=212767 RepID=UPI0002A54FC4|nr:hypothetical protein [Mycobacterium sp. JS623]AGB20602.1 hypothetical protein Mycsm_00141 [Mycobacterium sp. JS623]